MNPSYNPYEHSPELPRTDLENGIVAEVSGKNKLQSEKNSQIAELPGTHLPPTQQPVNDNNGAPIAPPPMQGSATDNTQIQVDGIALPQNATDEDLIETEWINRAKAIVDKTREDPHRQNKEMNKMKATYIKKRFNKDVKVVEE